MHIIRINLFNLHKVNRIVNIILEIRKMRLLVVGAAYKILLLATARIKIQNQLHLVVTSLHFNPSPCKLHTHTVVTVELAPRLAYRTSEMLKSTVHGHIFFIKS